MTQAFMRHIGGKISGASDSEQRERGRSLWSVGAQLKYCRKNVALRLLARSALA